MAKLRKWAAYRTVERPYTRWSKVRKKAFVKSRPGKKVIKFDMGDLVGGTGQFSVKLEMISKDLVQVRANAIEAARITSLKLLESQLGRLGFYFKILMVPHHAIRENALAAGAGADRLSTGMKHSFGKIIGTAARVEKGKVLMEVYVPVEKEGIGREALKKASKKLPLKTTIQTTKRKAIKLTTEQFERQQVEKEKIAKQDAARKVADAEKAADASKKEEAKSK